MFSLVYGLDIVSLRYLIYMVLGMNFLKVLIKWLLECLDDQKY
jgi:hypothetical protein